MSELPSGDALRILFERILRTLETVGMQEKRVTELLTEQNRLLAQQSEELRDMREALEARTPTLNQIHTAVTRRMPRRARRLLALELMSVMRKEVGKRAALLLAIGALIGSALGTGTGEVLRAWLVRWLAG